VVEEGGDDDGLPFVHPGSSGGLPGTRAPHVWLERNGARVSTLDLFGARFAVLAGPEARAWCEAAERADAALAIHRVGARALDDPDSRFLSAYGLEATGAVVVRPDGYVGWRARDEAGASREAIAGVLTSLRCLG
jgi:hypothetical protein